MSDDTTPETPENESAEEPTAALEHAQSTDALPTPPPRTAAAEVIGVRHGMFGAKDGGDTSGYGNLVRTITVAEPAKRPYGSYFDEVADELDAALRETTGDEGAYGDAVEKVVVDRGELTFYVRASHLVATAKLLRDEPGLRFEMCQGTTGVHYPEETGRELHSIVHLLSITHNRRIRIETAVPDANPHLPSLVSVYPAVDWHERESYDMFGIIYDGHPALTRILMPDDWPGHPQRKDYPLGGIPVEYKGAQIPAPDVRRSYS